MKPRKKWEPEYRFGGDRTDWCKPPMLGEYTRRPVIKKPRKKK